MLGQAVNICFQSSTCHCTASNILQMDDFSRPPPLACFFANALLQMPMTSFNISLLMHAAGASVALRELVLCLWGVSVDTLLGAENTCHGPGSPTSP